VNVWTVNDEAMMSRLIELAVDGIITDKPDVRGAIQKSSQTDTHQFLLSHNQHCDHRAPCKRVAPWISDMSVCGTYA
jgi:hypothetical protein